MSFSKKLIEFVFSDDDEGVTHFVHQTEYAQTAEEILQTGFFFSDSFQKTTDLLLNDPVYINYWFNIRKQYGIYTVILGISEKTLDNYQKSLKEMSEKNYEVYQLLTDHDTFNNSDMEEIHILPSKFVKGFMNREDHTIKYNPFYDPFYDSPKFKQNLSELQQNG